MHSIRTTFSVLLLPFFTLPAWSDPEGVELPEVKPVFTDHATGLTFQSQMAGLPLMHAGYFMSESPSLIYSNDVMMGNGDLTLNFEIENNKFMQLQDLGEQEWKDIEKHAKELYRINAPFHPGEEVAQDAEKYTHQVTASKTLEMEWAQHGKALVWTGWQNFPAVKNQLPRGKWHNLHLLVIKEKHCFYVTYSSKKEIKIEDRDALQLVDLLLDFIETGKMP